jgi:polysaccharide export outer membrane protein
VWIDEYRSFFVNGMVRGETVPSNPANVRKAVSIAGRFKERASVNKIFLVRDRDPAHQPAKVDLNAEIAPGDTITVEESFF